MLLMRLLQRMSILRRVSFGKPSRRMTLFPDRSIESNWFCGTACMVSAWQRAAGRAAAAARVERQHVCADYGSNLRLCSTAACVVHTARVFASKVGEACCRRYA